MSNEMSNDRWKCDTTINRCLTLLIPYESSMIDTATPSHWIVYYTMAIYGRCFTQLKLLCVLLLFWCRYNKLPVHLLHGWYCYTAVHFHSRRWLFFRNIFRSTVPSVLLQTLLFRDRFRFEVVVLFVSNLLSNRIRFRCPAVCLPSARYLL